MKTKIKRVVLDAQGVTFNAPLKSYLKKVEREIGQKDNKILNKWLNTYRELAWLGDVNDKNLVYHLTEDKMKVDVFLKGLELEYKPGPLAPYLPELSKRLPLWMLSNHRSHWLLERLFRFNYRSYFQKVLISEEIGLIKPDPRCFRMIVRDLKPEEVLYIDDQIKNIHVAESQGCKAIYLNKDEVAVRVFDYI